MAPLVMDVAKLLGLQLGTSLLAGVLMTILDSTLGLTPGSGWIGGMGCMLGGMAFAMDREAKQPGSLTVETRHAMAGWATAGQVVVGLALLPFAAPRVFSLPVGWLVVILVLTALASYGMTRLGFRMGTKNAARAR
jgi:hypothetical protein